GGRPKAADGASPADEGAKEADNLVHASVDIVRETGDKHRIDERIRCRHAQAAAAHECTAASFRSEQLIPGRVEDYRDLRNSANFEGERRAEDGQAVRVVRRAVERIEHPTRTRWNRGSAAELLSKYFMVGEALRNQFAQHALDGQ